MEYLKIVENGIISSSSNMYGPEEFDSRGLKARFKVLEGTLNLYCGKKGKYVIEKGETVEFVGKITYYGVVELQYILFDMI